MITDETEPTKNNPLQTQHEVNNQLKDFSWYVPVLCKLKNIFDLSFLYENEHIKSTIKIGLDFYLCPIKS